MSRTRKKWRSKLLAALEVEDLETFNSILSEAASRGEAWNQPFWWSCFEAAARREGGHVFVEALLAAGVRPRRNRRRPEPVHLACRRGHDENLKALLEDRRTDINAVDGSGRTALHHLAIDFDEGHLGHSKCLSLLLARPDLDVNLPSKKGFTALHEAANRKSLSFVRTILTNQVSLELDQHFACGRTSRDAVLENLPSLSNLLPPVRRVVLDVSSDAQAQLLHLLRKRKLKDFVSLLYQVDDDFRPLVNPDHWYEDSSSTCLREAARGVGNPECVRYLLRAGANPNLASPNDGSVPLHCAVERANFPAMNLLTHCERTDLNAANFDGETALHLAVKGLGGTGECEECLRLLLQHPSIDASKRDSSGETALTLATAKGDEASVRRLLPHSPHLNAYSGNSNTVVKDLVTEKFPHMSEEIESLASRCTDRLAGKEQLVKYLSDNDLKNFLKLFKHLVKSDKDILYFRIGVEPILQYACRNGMLDVVNTVLKSGADPNVLKSANCRHPLIVAVIYQQHGVLSLLLKLRQKIGLNVNITDERGNSALHYADLNEDLETIVELLRHGANISLRNIHGKLGLQPKILAKVLDSSITPSDHYPHDTEYKLNFDFTPVINKANEVTFPSVSEDQVWLNIDSSMETTEVNKYSKRKESEMEFFNYLCGCIEYRDLLLHPTVKLFLDLKWGRLKLIFYVRIILYAVFVFLLNMYILMCDLKDQRGSPSNIEASAEYNLSTAADGRLPVEWSKPKKAFMSALFLVLFLATMFDTAVTMYKIPLRLIKPCGISVSPGATRSIFSFSRAMDLSVNIFTSVFLYKIKAESVQEISAVIIILCSWTKLMLLLANFRRPFSNAKILESVLDRYAPCLASYYLVVVGFAFSFNILLKDEEYFSSPWMSLFKTTVMLTGDLGMKSDMFTINPGVSHVVFLLFILLMVVVFLNFLSVFLDDAEEVRKHAQTLQFQDKVELLSEIESFLIRFRKIKFFSCCIRRSNYVFGWFRNISVFPENSNKIITVFPNRLGHLQFADGNYASEIDDTIIKSASALVSGAHNFCSSSDMVNVKNSLQSQSQLLLELKENQRIIKKYIKQFAVTNSPVHNNNNATHDEGLLYSFNSQL